MAFKNHLDTFLYYRHCWFPYAERLARRWHFPNFDLNEGAKSLFATNEGEGCDHGRVVNHDVMLKSLFAPNGGKGCDHGCVIANHLLVPIYTNSTRPLLPVITTISKDLVVM